MSRLQSATDVRPLREHIRPAARDGYAEVAPALEAPRGSAASALAARFRGHSPILVFWLATIAGYLLLVAAAIGVGFLLVDVLLPIHAIGHADESVNDSLAAHRNSTLNDASYVGSMIGDIPFIPGLVIITAVAAAILRRWRVAAFIVGAILVEVATYRLTSLIVHRDRPAVPRLDHLPVNQSYPSGHVAASVVVYVGLALLITSRFRERRRLVTAVWALAVALPLVVALSRMYRGMHHPTDAFAGILIGLASLAIALLAARAAGTVARARSDSNGEGARA